MAIGALSTVAHADCSKLPSHATLRKALMASVKQDGGPSNGGLDLNMWATEVDRD